MRVWCNCSHVFAACSVVTALEAATLHPAQAVGIQDTKGTLKFGADADFVFLGEDLNVWSTWIAGECVFQDVKSPRPTVRQVRDWTTGTRFVQLNVKLAVRLGAVQMLCCSQQVSVGAQHHSDFCKVVFSTLFMKYRNPIFFRKSLISRLQNSSNA